MQAKFFLCGWCSRQIDQLSSSDEGVHEEGCELVMLRNESPTNSRYPNLARVKLARALYGILL